MASKDAGSKTGAEVLIVQGRSTQTMPDQLATEEPLEIRLGRNGKLEPLAVTMRTPGADLVLAAGFLYAEGVVRSRADIVRLEHPAQSPAGDSGNIVEVELAGGVDVDLSNLERHFYTSSACGVCGKTSLDALMLRGSPPPPGLEIDAGVLHSLPEKLRRAQGVFQATGGLHAAALFDAGGDLVAVREDVGRHNAVDKLVGWALLEDRLPLHQHIVLVSGRSSYEILQKCLMAGVPVVCAVSAPSSLAVSVARRFGMTLVGFLREGRFNVYTGSERLRLE